MRRAANLWPQIAAFGPLCRAAHRAARGKRSSHAVAAFLERLEPECLRLERALLAGAWRPSRARSFVIHDPKRRTITAVPFRDRVVHHALMAPLQPIFERRMIGDSHACRPGLGTSSALRRANLFVRRHRYALKLDVQAFFDSLRHADVLAMVARVVKDREVLTLCQTILHSTDPDARGLPIGSLTSQWFANLALDPLDHLVKETLRIPGYLRYIDDFALFADDKQRLHDAHAQIAHWLAEHLDLRLKDRATRLAPTTDGLHFLGFTLRPGSVRLRPANLRRFRWRLRWLRRELARGRISEDRYVRAVAAVFEHIRPADTLALRRRLAAELEDDTRDL